MLKKDYSISFIQKNHLFIWFSFAIFFFFLSIGEVQGQSCNFHPGYSYKTAGSSAVYYITDICTKRAFTRSEIFFTYFSSWNDVEYAPAQALRAVPNDPLGFMPHGPLYDPQYGALVKTVADPKVYLLLGGEKYWITSEDVFNALGYRWDWIEDVDTRLLEKYSLGSEITNTDRHPNFTLVKYADSPKVYRLEPDANGMQVKRHIADEDSFRALRFRSDRIVTIQPSETYSDGSPLTAADVKSKPSDIPTSSLTQPTVGCVSNPNPVFSHFLVDPALVVNITTPPNIHKASGHLKTHSYLNTDKVGIPIYAPVDMELFNGAHYIGGPYSLDFRVSCEVRLRLAHIDPVQKIKDAFPKEAKTDSKDTAVNPTIRFKAGDLIAYIYQDVGVLSVGLDFGLYHSQKPNRYAMDSNPEITQSSIYTTAVCPYDYFVPDIAAQYKTKYNLVKQEGMQVDGVSFCQ